MTQVEGSTVLVTGANRGIGLALAREFLGRGAAKVYAAARDPKSITEPGVIPVQLDITDPKSVKAAAEFAGDVTVLVNNAGLLFAEDALEASLDHARQQLEVNYLGTLSTTQAFAPVIIKNGGGAVVNIISSGSWVGVGKFSTYGASKAAQWGITNALRAELRPQGVQVTGVHVGFVETEMSAQFNPEGASSPDEVARITVEGLIAGNEEVLVDEYTQDIKAHLSDEKASYLV